MLDNRANNRIIVISHSNPDVDSIISGVLMKKILYSKGYIADYIIPDEEISEESVEICLKYGINPKDYQGEVPKNANLFLVDHHKTDIKGNIIGIIDHHPTMEKIECNRYTNEASSSTAMLIYKLDPNVFDINDIKRVAVANLVDTNCFSSTKTVKDDKEWTINICKEKGFNYEKMYNDGLCLTDTSDLNKAAVNGEKSYCYDKNKIKSSYIQFKDLKNDKIEQVINILKNKINEEDLDMWVFITHNMNEFKSNAYLITDKNCEEINYDSVTSRGSTIMPYIEKRIIKNKER